MHPDQGMPPPEPESSRGLSRRRFLGGVSAAAVSAMFLAACGGDDDEGDGGASPSSATGGTSTSAAGGTSAAFTFTDGRGETITLDKKPERIVAYAAPAAALYDLGIKPVGIFTGSPLEEAPNLVGMSTSTASRRSARSMARSTSNG